MKYLLLLMLSLSMTSFAQIQTLEQSDFSIAPIVAGGTPQFVRVFSYRVFSQVAGFSGSSIIRVTDFGGIRDA